MMNVTETRSSSRRGPLLSARLLSFKMDACRGFLFSSALGLLMLSGCAMSSPEGKPAPRLGFEQYQTQSLHVAQIGLTERYLVENDPNDVAGQFVIAPNEAIKQYVARRFASNGMGAGRFDVVIRDARVHLNALKQDNKVLQWSGIGQEDEYKVSLEVDIVTLPDGVMGAQKSTIKMSRTLVMPSSVPLSDREQRQLNFMEKLIRDVDAAIQKILDDIPSIRL